MNKNLKVAEQMLGEVSANWSCRSKEDFLAAVRAASMLLDGYEPVALPTDPWLRAMAPKPEEARRVLQEPLSRNPDDLYKSNLMEVVGRALGFLRGYELPKNVLSKYKCSFCGASHVKLWRGIGSAQEAWCSKCAMAQAGFHDTIDDEGMHIAEFSGRADGRSDQIYNSKKGQNLLPWVPAPDGETWGYTSVPPEGCEWWRAVPTR